MCGRWTSVSDETSDLRRIKLLNVVDELTREALAVEAAHSIEARAVLENRRVEYNTYRSHQPLGGLTPAAYADHCKTHQHQPTHP